MPRAQPPRPSKEFFQCIWDDGQHGIRECGWDCDDTTDFAILKANAINCNTNVASCFAFGDNLMCGGAISIRSRLLLCLQLSMRCDFDVDLRWCWVTTRQAGDGSSAKGLQLPVLPQLTWPNVGRYDMFCMDNVTHPHATNKPASDSFTHHMDSRTPLKHLHSPITAHEI